MIHRRPESIMTESTFSDRPSPRHAAADSTVSTDARYAEALQRARHRVRMQRGWFLHATVYAIVITGLWAAWAFGMARFPWPLPPTLGWGLGLAIHGFVVLARSSDLASAWERRRIEAYVRQELADGRSGH